MTELPARPPGQLRILVVDDDATGRYLLGQQLRLAGYEATLTDSTEQALVALANQPADVLIADINLPGQSGLDLLRQVRARFPRLEVIMLTGRPSVDSAIQALRDGASDYLTKPVSGRQLIEALSRVAERLRQARQRQEALSLLEAGLRQIAGHEPAGPLPAVVAAPAGAPAPPAAEKQFRIGPVLLDLDRFVIEVNGQPVDATPSEIEILHYLCRHPDRVITPAEMVQSIRGYRVEPAQAPELIRPHISNLRRKLHAAQAEADIVRTVRGVGYMIKTPTERPA